MAKEIHSFQKPTEKGIVQGIMRYLQKQPDPKLFWKTHGGAFSGKSGMPDILYLEPRPGGGVRMLVLEVKVPGKKATKLQQEMLTKMQAVGVVATVVYSREDVEALLTALRRDNHGHPESL